MAFDIEGARKAGYSDAEIAGHLAKSRGFDLAGARKSGYSDSEVIAHLSAKSGSMAGAIPVGVDEQGRQVTQAQALAQQPARVEPERGIGERLAGVAEAGATMATGVPASVLGLLGALNEALNPQNLRSGTAMQSAEQRFGEIAGGATYQPRTETGQAIVETVGEAASALPPIIGGAPALLAQSGALRPAAQAATAATMATAGRVSKAAAPAIQRATQAAQSLRPGEPAAFGRGSVSAAEATKEAVRREVGAQMPAPFTGEFELTKGMATRNYDQLAFEKEVAKQEVGAPLRERQENLTARVFQNFDVLIENRNPQTLDRRNLGQAVDRALVNKAKMYRGQIDAAYNKAREAGQLQSPVTLDPLAAKLEDLRRFEGVTSNIVPIRREAIRLGAMAEDADGNLVINPVKIDDAELLRQFVNDATDWTDKRQARAAKIINGAIDDSLEGQGGELYKQARALRRGYAQEFENVGITKRLLGTKKGTDERQIAYDDVFHKVILDSPVDEMNKVRRTLLTAGPEGRAAWNDLKTQTIQYIKSQAENTNNRDSQGRPLLSNARLNEAVKSLDADGKLESLFGKKQAEMMRDLADLAVDIQTAPPGAINTSNTSASILKAFGDAAVTGSLTGVPLPVLTVIKEASKYAKNAKTRQRVAEALRNQSAKRRGTQSAN